MMKNLALFALTAIGLSSCGVGVNNLKKLNFAALSVGDRILIQSDAVIYACDPADTASAFWFGSDNQKVCLKAKGDISQYDKNVGVVTSGTEAVVSRLKFINGIDSTYHLAYLKVSGVDGELAVYDFNFPNLLGITAGR